MNRRQTLMRPPTFALVFGAALAVAAQQSAGPLEPIGVVVDALRKNPIVALGEVHGNEQCQHFRLALLRDTRVTDLVNDIVVEFGNAKYQDVVDSFVAGGNVGDAELRHVWQDTTQISGVWDRPMYGDFFRAVRDFNVSVPQNRRLRVLLGDPPVDWELMRRINEGPENEREGKVRINGIWVAREDAQSLDRDAYAADVVRREVLANGRRALLLFGEMHVRRTGKTVVSRIETSTGAKVFSIVNATGTNYDALRTLFPDMQSWPVPRAVLTPAGAFSSGPFSESDAVLYLGPPSALTQSKLAAALCSDVGYLGMRRERMRWAGMPENTAKQLLARDCPR
jgi:Haem-binding uptake, Tiki superfamily, ChaN